MLSAPQGLNRLIDARDVQSYKVLSCKAQSYKAQSYISQSHIAQSYVTHSYRALFYRVLTYEGQSYKALAFKASKLDLINSLLVCVGLRKIIVLVEKTCFWDLVCTATVELFLAWSLYHTWGDLSCCRGRWKRLRSRGQQVTVAGRIFKKALQYLPKDILIY